MTGRGLASFEGDSGGYTVVMMVVGTAGMLGMKLLAEVMRF